jgi:uncharacterized protein YdeI (YjbR/CyaY-like superfamily)
MVMLENRSARRDVSMPTWKAGSELSIEEFESASDWGRWLERNHSKVEGVWVRFFKKGSGVSTVNYEEALEEALCYGWIDGQVKKHDEKSYLQKFTPRRARSLWSKRNVGKATGLIETGRMRAAGLKEIEAAKKDGRWESAYDSPSGMKVPVDFLRELSKDKKAREFFKGLDRANRYAVLWRLQTAKSPETRARRKKAILEMLAKGEKFH